MAPRVLIFTASIGAGHDLPAEVLAAALREQGATVEIADFLPIAGPVARAIIGGASSLETRAGNIAFDAGYFLGTRFAPLRRVGSPVIELIAGRRVRAYLAANPADVIVSTYPITSELLGRLRRAGHVRVPVVSAITDLAALHYWAHPGIDLHLITHPESEAEVRTIAGPGARIAAVHGLTDPRFTTPLPHAQARTELGLAGGDGRLVVVSGGGWGVGDLRGAADDALAAGAQAVIVLVGHNAGAKARLEEAYASEPRLQVWGFTDRMVTLLSGADVLVHSTAGLTVLEALMCGCRVISYGWARGHIRVNNRAYERLGMVAVARDRAALARALRDALAAPRPGPQVPDLPPAAGLVLALADADRPARVAGAPR